MQRKRNDGRRAGPYAVRGGEAPRNVKQRKSSTAKARRLLQRLIIAAAVLAAVILCIYGLTQLTGGSESQVRLNCLATDHIELFGEDVLYYNGVMLSCADASGSIRWQFQLGAGADFHASGRMIVAWVANQLYVINANGVSTFNNRMNTTVQFARIGESYVAAFLGEEDKGEVRVMDHQGNLLESIKEENLFMLDIGFFGTRGRLMWTTGLDIKGIAPITTLKTYEPGQLATGAVNLGDQLIYRIFNDAQNRMMLVNTQQIVAYDYKCKPDASIDPVLIYGWQFQALRNVGKNRYVLLQHTPDSDGTTRSAEMRLLTNAGRDEILRLPGACFAGGLGDQYVYGFSNNAIHYAKYGTHKFSTKVLGFAITQVFGILEKDQVVAASGSDVFIMKLPT